MADTHQIEMLQHLRTCRASFGLAANSDEVLGDPYSMKRFCHLVGCSMGEAPIAGSKNWSRERTLIGRKEVTVLAEIKEAGAFSRGAGGGDMGRVASTMEVKLHAEEGLQDLPRRDAGAGRLGAGTSSRDKASNDGTNGCGVDR